MKKTEFVTSESVTMGHPDKFCDYLSDFVLDEHLKQDENSRVACEVMASDNLVVLAGQITSKAQVDYQEIVKKAYEDVGYGNPDNLEIIVKINKQSKDIALGVDEGIDFLGEKTKSMGAGDQGLMFGYASDETKELMPLGTSLVNGLVKELDRVRTYENFNLKSDGKAQISLRYENHKPVHIDAIVFSSQHKDDYPITAVRADLKGIIRKIIPEELCDSNTKILLNPTGRFVTGGMVGDAGLTGRKIIVDTYGGYIRHGGGAFSGKDPTKIDRSGAYMARFIAKNIVFAGLAKRCEVLLAYAIGVSKPVSINIDTFDTEKVPINKIIRGVEELFDLTPEGIIKILDLKKLIYKSFSTYGHMGREDLDAPWERTNKAKELLDYLG